MYDQTQGYGAVFVFTLQITLLYLEVSKSQLDETSAFAFLSRPLTLQEQRIAFHSERKASVNNPSKSRTQ